MINLNTYFDKIFYINLDKDIERNQHILSEFKKWNITNFEKIKGHILTEIPDSIYWRNFGAEVFNENYILGSLGCRRSNLEIIKLSIERNYSKILILEDDISFTKDPHQLLRDNIVNIIKEWDMLYFGGIIKPHAPNQIFCTHAYGINKSLFTEILTMAPYSGMEIDVFYAKIIQQMICNYNALDKYNVKIIEPFNTVIQNQSFKSNIKL